MREFLMNKLAQLKTAGVPVADFLADEEGVGTIEIVLILVVLIALVLIFRTRLTALIKKVFDAMDQSAAELYENKT